MGHHFFLSLFGLVPGLRNSAAKLSYVVIAYDYFEGHFGSSSVIRDLSFLLLTSFLKHSLGILGQG